MQATAARIFSIDVLSTMPPLKLRCGPAVVLRACVRLRRHKLLLGPASDLACISVDPSTIRAFANAPARLAPCLPAPNF